MRLPGMAGIGAGQLGTAAIGAIGLGVPATALPVSPTAHTLIGQQPIDPTPTRLAIIAGRSL